MQAQMPPQASIPPYPSIQTNIFSQNFFTVNNTKFSYTVKTSSLGVVILKSIYLQCCLVEINGNDMKSRTVEISFHLRKRERKNNGGL
jgi:hypothetical protein